MKMFGRSVKSRGNKPQMMHEKVKDNPKGYEGKEHVKYRDPGYSRHEIRIPEDTPHMKSHVSQDEEHEMEDNYHMGVPDQTDYDLPKKIKSAHMLMDAPNQQDPKPLRGNIVHNVPFKGEEDTDGKEEMGPRDMQMGDGSPLNSLSKDKRKKMAVGIMRRKMKRHEES